MPAANDDTGRIIRFLLVKVAVFIGIPLVAALAAVYFTLH